MSSRDRPTTPGYWIAVTVTALALRLFIALFLFRDCPQKSDSLEYADQARAMAAGKWVKPNFWPAGRSLVLVPFFLAFGTSETTVEANSIAFERRLRSASGITRAPGSPAPFRGAAHRLAGGDLSADGVALVPKLLRERDHVFPARLRQRGDRGVRRPERLAEGGNVDRGGLLFGRSHRYAALCAQHSRRRRDRHRRLVDRSTILAETFRHGHAGACILAKRLRRWLAVSLGVLACEVPLMWHNASLGRLGYLGRVHRNKLPGWQQSLYAPLQDVAVWGSCAMVAPEFQAYLSPFLAKGVPRSALLREAIRYILERPDIFALRTMNRIRAFWGFDYYASSYFARTENKARLAICLVVEAGGYCLTMLLVIGGLFLFSKGMEGRYAAFSITLALAYQLPYAVTHSAGTWHIPVMGLLFPFAGLALDEAWQGRTGGWPALVRRKWFWMAMVAFILVQIEYAYWVPRVPLGGCRNAARSDRPQRGAADRHTSRKGVRVHAPRCGVRRLAIAGGGAAGWAFLPDSRLSVEFAAGDRTDRIP